jgi:hypothetical protein
MIHEAYRPAAKEALDALLAYFGGNKSQLAAACGVTRNTVSFWFSKQYIGRDSAMVIDGREDIPFGKEFLRPDIKVWSVYKQPATK